MLLSHSVKATQFPLRTTWDQALLLRSLAPLSIAEMEGYETAAKMCKLRFPVLVIITVNRHTSQYTGPPLHPKMGARSTDQFASVQKVTASLLHKTLFCAMAAWPTT